MRTVDWLVRTSKDAEMNVTVSCDMPAARTYAALRFFARSIFARINFELLGLPSLCSCQSDGALVYLAYV